jgi:hypothetical protein
MTTLEVADLYEGGRGGGRPFGSNLSMKIMPKRPLG